MRLGCWFKQSAEKFSRKKKIYRIGERWKRVKGGQRLVHNWYRRQDRGEFDARVACEQFWDKQAKKNAP
ncbi:hypothetical protein EOS_33800 [Caballeronia mineralivorans PML1(12)]|uniref:Uncharacterized protein n=1 Tax=Caballeronia mineralivorans PML1(12) TaxID=908627 RepID=A0A0J1CM10_9BURK|nr:hypothetical protein EOS_33800 [Caballeronia mineralivorans PML1(12)]